MLIHNTPLGLASEEFIPVASEVAPNSENVVVPFDNPQQLEAGSQIDRSDKSESVQFAEIDDVNLAGTKNEGKDADSVAPESETSDSQQQVESKDSTHRNGRPVTNPPGAPSDLNQAGEKDSTLQSVNVNSDTVINGLAQDSVNEVDLTKSNSERNNNSSPDIAKNVESAHLASDNSGEKMENESQSVPTQVEPPLSSNSPPIPTPHPNKEDEPIPSFMEWTQQKLHESNLANGATGSAHVNGQNGHRSTHSANTQQNKSSLTGTHANVVKSRKDSNAKNFASPDCGAKVIQSNPESQNANGVLSSSHDEYMLNK